jgi:hypothetical protein
MLTTHSPSSAEVVNEGSYTLSPPSAFVVCSGTALASNLSIYTIFIIFFISLAVYPCFAVKNYTGTSGSPSRALLLTNSSYIFSAVTGTELTNNEWRCVRWSACTCARVLKMPWQRDRYNAVGKAERPTRGNAASVSGVIETGPGESWSR